MASKVVVVGAIEGNLRRAFSKLSNVQAKQNFAFAIVVGDLFGDPSSDLESEELDSLLNGSLSVPLPTYFSVGNTTLPGRVIEKLQTSDEVCPNLFFLGRKGTIKTSEGIRIVVLGGKLVEQDAAGSATLNNFDRHYTAADARGLYGVHSAHILITNEFPKGILGNSKKTIPDPVKAIEGQQCVAELCMTLRPRYHFSNSPVSAFEREPFEQPANYETMDQEAVTRFEGLASLANSNKENKWLSAFKLDPSGPPPSAENRTASPLAKVLSKSKNTHGLPSQAQSYSRYRNGGDEEENPHKRRRFQQTKGARIEGCFFCLHDPDARTYLIGSIGSLSYLTVARGPLPLRNTFPSLGFPGHILIIPTTHAPGDLLSQTSTNSGAGEEYQEMQDYRRALYKMVGEKSSGSLGAVCWEANRSKVRHQHWQFCPVSAQHVTSGLVEAAFKVDRENNQYSLFQSCDSGKVLDQKSDYFRVWVWSPSAPSNPIEAADRVSNAENEGAAGAERSMFFPLPAQQKFDLQFGRKVLAKVLKLEDRSDWRAAEQTEAEEKKDVAAFREAFKDYDFSLE